MGVYALRGYVLGLQSGKAALRFLWARARRQPAPPASAEMYVLSQAWQVRRDRIPGMTRVSERSFCEWYTRHRHPAGAIVELGPWLGALTRALARGLRARGLVDRVESYDLFVWQPYMDQLVAGTPFEAIATGDDFRQQFLAALGHLGEHVNARRADLAVEGWDGGPISLLVIDAMKGWRETANIARRFLPAVQIDGLVMHQDFAHPWCPWIPLITYRQREQLVVFRDVPESDTVVFRVTQPLDIPPISWFDPGEYTRDEVDEALEFALRETEQSKWRGLLSGRVVFHAAQGDLEYAQHLLDDPVLRALGGADANVVALAHGEWPPVEDWTWEAGTGLPTSPDAE
jgi:hypothetical protein